MEERLKYAIECLRLKGNPESAGERLLIALGLKRNINSLGMEYSQARSEGLNINEAELSTTICDGLRSLGIEGFITRLENQDNPAIKKKRKRRQAQEEDIKKKPKKERVISHDSL